jgi:adenylate kinase family enzyme
VISGTPGRRARVDRMRRGPCRNGAPMIKSPCIFRLFADRDPSLFPPWLGPAGHRRAHTFNVREGASVGTDRSIARVSVVGVSGAGKSTLARLAAARLGLPYIELDAIHHGPHWTEIPGSELRRIVTQLVAGDAWVIDKNYRKVRDLVWGRATTVAWVDPSRPGVMAQVLWRSVARAVSPFGRRWVLQMSRKRAVPPYRTPQRGTQHRHRLMFREGPANLGMTALMGQVARARTLPVVESRGAGTQTPPAWCLATPGFFIAG